jgi:hypothetical protein
MKSVPCCIRIFMQWAVREKSDKIRFQGKERVREAYKGRNIAKDGSPPAVVPREASRGRAPGVLINTISIESLSRLKQTVRYEGHIEAGKVTHQSM